jgi:hypothetical protein
MVVARFPRARIGSERIPRADPGVVPSHRPKGKRTRSESDTKRIGRRKPHLFVTLRKFVSGPQTHSRALGASLRGSEHRNPLAAERFQRAR